MNIDKFTIDTQPFEKTLTFRLASPALDQSAAAALGEWNSPIKIIFIMILQAGFLCVRRWGIRCPVRRL